MDTSSAKFQENTAKEMGTFVLLVLSIVLIPNSLAAYTSTPWNYGVMFDAGSSSSKLKIYRWPTRVVSTEALALELIHDKKFKPGISNYMKNLEAIPGHLMPMLDEAKTHVPQTLHDSTPLFMMATAGLRVLPEADAIALMTTARQILSNASINPFIYRDRRVRILSGEEEGAYAWIAANYLREFFGSDGPPSHAVGVLEMGGGSTQIAFLPDGPVYANMFPVRMAGVSYHLYAHSYLYYGQNYMTYRIRRYLVNQDPQATEIYDPCMLDGDVNSYTEGDNIVIVRGGSNPTKCLEILNSFLQSADDEECYPKPCAIGQIYQPSLGTDIFFAISAYVYAPKILNALDPYNRLEIRKLNTSAHEYCEMSLTQAINATGTPPNYASGYCMMGLYIPSLLTTSYGFKSNTMKIHITEEIGDQSVDWALGAILYELEQLEYNNCYDEASGSTSYRVNGILCSILIIVTLFMKYISVS